MVEEGNPFEVRVAHAYHDYARFCSAHPNCCLCISLVMMILLSYPAIIRFRLPTSSSLDVFVTRSDSPLGNVPEWYRPPPIFYVQQVVVRTTLPPGTRSPDQALRSSFWFSFGLRLSLLSHLSPHCLSVPSYVPPKQSPFSFLPTSGCLLLSPPAIWGNDLDSFMKDSNVLRTVMSLPCESTMCARDMLTGMSVDQTWTGGQKSMEYSLTVVLSSYDAHSIGALRLELTRNASVPDGVADDTNVHLVYRQKKYLVDYFPLIMSYVAFMLYLYFSASKFEMVSSRWGLALAAGGSVVFSLLMTAGIAVLLDLGPALWGGEIFPYLALILGLENILCITKSVVYTPPTMDVPTRLSLGLSSEGYSLTKYFVLELVFLAVAFFSLSVPEVREFCKFASIALVVDFYMQLFFYAPCLTFDLRRLTDEEKKRFSRMLLSTDIPRLRTFAPVSCPMRRVLPSLFSPTPLLRRVHSEPRLLEETPSLPMTKKTHRRTVSAYKADMVERIQTVESQRESTQRNDYKKTSNRLRILYFVSRTRIFQRSFMVVFIVWTLWLGVLVHWRNSTASPDVNSRGILWTEWGEWQRRTFRWWPSILSEYNISLSNRFVTFLPPIVLHKKIPLLDAPSVGIVETDDPSELKFRIHWLETQLKVYLALSSVFLFSAVALFLVYVCCWDEWKKKKERKRPSINKPTPSHCPSTLVLSTKGIPIESLIVINDDVIVASTQDGNVILWHLKNEQRLQIDRKRGDQVWPVWAMCCRLSVVLLACADGCVEVICTDRRLLIASLHTRKESATHIQVRGSSVVVGRIDGSLELASLELNNDTPLSVDSFVSLRVIAAHRGPIRFLQCAPLSFISVGLDSSLKAVDARSGDSLFSLVSHSAPIACLSIDHHCNMAFSSSSTGVLCGWHLSGHIAWTSADPSGGPSPLIVMRSQLVSLGCDGRLTLWEKTTGKVVTRLGAEEARRLDGHILAVGEGTVAVGRGRLLSFWDVQRKVLVGEMEVDRWIDQLHPLSPSLIIILSQSFLSIVKIPQITFR